MSRPQQIPDLLFTGRSAQIIVAPRDPTPEDTPEFRMLSTMCEVWCRIYPDATEAEFDAMVDRFARELGL